MVFHPRTCDEVMDNTKGQTLPGEIEYEISRKLAPGKKKAHGAGGAQRN